MKHIMYLNQLNDLQKELITIDIIKYFNENNIDDYNLNDIFNEKLWILQDLYSSNTFYNDYYSKLVFILSLDNNSTYAYFDLNELRNKYYLCY